MRIVFIFLFIIFSSCKTSRVLQQNDCCTSKLAKKGFDHYRLKKLGKEYLLLKSRNDKCCKKYNSDFHKIIQVLAEKLNQLGKDTCSIIKIMGAADANEVPKQYGIFNTGNEKIMVYWWRDWRDFLYIISENGKIKYVKWFYAWE
jgi:hypothetical protein